MTFGPYGDNWRTVTINSTMSIIHCGCFEGNLEEFKIKVQLKYGTDMGDYARLIKILESLKQA